MKRKVSISRIQFAQLVGIATAEKEALEKSKTFFQAFNFLETAMKIPLNEFAVKDALKVVGISLKKQANYASISAVARKDKRIMVLAIQHLYEKLGEETSPKFKELLHRVMNTFHDEVPKSVAVKKCEECSGGVITVHGENVYCPNCKGKGKVAVVP